MKIHSSSLLVVTCVSSFVSPAASSIVAEGLTSRTTSSGTRELFSPFLSGGEPVPEAEGLNDTELLAKIEACKATQDNRKTAFLLPYLTEEFLNTTVCAGAPNQDPVTYWLLQFAAPAKFFLDSNVNNEFIGSDPSDMIITKALRQFHADVQWFWSLTEEVRAIDPLIGQMPLKGVHNTFFGNEDGSFERISDLRPALPVISMPDVPIPSFETASSCIADFVDSPGLTLNAKYIPPIQQIPGTDPGGQIMWGDGFVKFLQSLDNGDEEALLLRMAATHGHEYGHHVAINVGNIAITGMTAEQTRFSELLTDSLSGYWNAHSCGNAYKAEDFVVIEDTFSATGDCFFDNPGHHGTSDQRQCAARWGAYLAHENSEVMEPSSIIARFETSLSDIIAVDIEGACPLLNSTQAAESFSEKMECPWIRQPSAVRRDDDNSADGGREDDMDVGNDEIVDEDMSQALDEDEDDTTSSGYASIKSTFAIASCVFGSFFVFSAACKHQTMPDHNKLAVYSKLCFTCCHFIMEDTSSASQIQ